MLTASAGLVAALGNRLKVARSSRLCQAKAISKNASPASIFSESDEEPNFLDASSGSICLDLAPPSCNDGELRSERINAQNRRPIPA